MGIYITQQKKEEFQARIKELEKFFPLESEEEFIEKGQQILLEEILSSATILPVYETWQDVKAAPIFCKNGLIIKPKES
jgi:hypothetical protein